MTDAVEKIFGHATVEPVDAHSHVSEQPWGDTETLAGAANRARACRAATGAHLGVGIEAGLVELADGAVEAVSWIVAVGIDLAGVFRRGQSRAASYLLPVELADLVRRGDSLGDATRRVFRSQPEAAGTVGPLTAGSLDRRGHYTSAVMLALIPFYPSNAGLTFVGERRVAPG